MYYRNAMIMIRKAIVINMTTNAISHTNYRIATTINLHYDLYYPSVRAKRIPNAAFICNDEDYIIRDYELRNIANTMFK